MPEELNPHPIMHVKENTLFGLRVAGEIIVFFIVGSISICIANISAQNTYKLYRTDFQSDLGLPWWLYVALTLFITGIGYWADRQEFKMQWLYTTIGFTLSPIGCILLVPIMAIGSAFVVIGFLFLCTIKCILPLIRYVRSRCI